MAPSGISRESGSKDVRGRVDEPTDGTGGSVDAVTGRQSVHIGNPGQKRRKP
jgi:hypothetical protein